MLKSKITGSPKISKVSLCIIYYKNKTLTIDAELDHHLSNVHKTMIKIEKIAQARLLPIRASIDKRRGNSENSKTRLGIALLLKTEYVYDKAKAILIKNVAVSDSRISAAAKQSGISQTITVGCLLSS